MIIIAVSISIAIVLIILIYDAFKYNKFEELIIRINEAEANIDAILNKRFDLLNKSINIIKAETKLDKEVLGDIVKIRSRKLNFFDLDEQLSKAYQEFNYYVNNYEVLKKNDAFTKIEIDLIESESSVIALKKYYNDVTEKYNKLIHKFPSNIIALFKKYKKRELFKEKEEEKIDYTQEIIFDDDKIKEPIIEKEKEEPKEEDKKEEK